MKNDWPLPADIRPRNFWAKGGVSCSPSCSLLRSAWVCLGVVRPVTITVSYVQLPHHIQKTLFPRCCVPPLALTIFLSPLPRFLSIGGRNTIMYAPFMSTPHSVHWDKLGMGCLLLSCWSLYFFPLSKYIGVKTQDTTEVITINCWIPGSQEPSLSLPHCVGLWCLSSWLLLKTYYHLFLFVPCMYFHRNCVQSQPSFSMNLLV